MAFAHLSASTTAWAFFLFPSSALKWSPPSRPMSSRGTMVVCVPFQPFPSCSVCQLWLLSLVQDLRPHVVQLENKQIQKRPCRVGTCWLVYLKFASY